MRKIDQASFEQAIIAEWDKIKITNEFSAMQKRAAPATARLAYVLLSELDRIPDGGDSGDIINLLAAINASVIHNISNRLNLGGEDTDIPTDLAIVMTLVQRMADYLSTVEKSVAGRVQLPTVDVGDA